MTTKFARDICARLRAADNVNKCRAALAERYPLHPLLAEVPRMMFNFTQHVAHDLSMSDPLPGVDSTHMLMEYNRQFLAYMIDMIEEHSPSDEMHYSMSDGLPAARSDYSKSADCLLSNWIDAPASMYAYREDPQSDGPNSYGAPLPSYGPVIHYRTDMYDGKCPPAHQYAARGGHSTVLMKSGCVPTATVDYTDMSGCNPAEATYENALTRAWNSPQSVLGDGSVAMDQSLLSRRIFRTESGVEGGIPFNRRTVHHRHVDRDISEGLRGDSRDYKLSGHDMRSLYDRVDKKTRNVLAREGVKKCVADPMWV